MTGACAPPRLPAEGEGCGAGGPVILHATCVAFGASGVVILGPSGAGKSALALQLLAFGAQLVADDRTELFAAAGGLTARAPAGLPGLIEARGLGLLRAPLAGPAVLRLAVDLGVRETARLPPRRLWHCCGIAVDCVHGPATPHFPAAIRQYLLQSRDV